MKRIILSFFLFFSIVFILDAQYAREEILQDRTLALGNMHPYRPLGDVFSPAPEGYELFYISHAGRHGSRYFDESSRRKRFMDMFRQYSQEKRFTKEGEMLYKDLQKIIKASEKNVGALSRLGEEELYQMGLRLDRNAGELFKGKGKKVITYTTNSPRVKTTRDCFVDGLLTHNPMLVVDTVKYASKGKAHHEVVGYHLGDDLKKLSNAHTVGLEQWKAYDPTAFLQRIFKDGCRDGLDRDVVYRLFECGTAYLSSGEKLPNILKYFSDYDLYNLWAYRAAGWVGRCTVTEQNKACRTLTMGRGIVDCIIEDADDVIAGKSDVCATLRFTHDSYMVPLMSYMDIEGVNFKPVESAIGNFKDYELVSMGTNTQMFFYRNASGDILVKILVNERESVLASLAPVEGVFYRWDDLKKFWLERGVQLQKLF